MATDDSPVLTIPDDYHLSLRVSEQGTVVSVGDGIVWVTGLPSAMMEEVLHLEGGSTALVFLLEPDQCASFRTAAGHRCR